ncbi:PTS sugar transporter subunit IIA [Lachnoclostridium sp. Marseille-P6806]|uniref:PTS sugar transporter subunit IIA n=1 Tax=Lachnoclostridium sp. Marseille-P6806 TaxID=2364793 RepID=UPI001F5EC3E5|nr:PTS glucose transporter subunit IIA [Lachnoclostridium sp. Marseille-P6806]
MNFLKKLLGGRREDELAIASPAKGLAVDITSVKDPTFSEKLLGDGAAVLPSEGTICAPADGKLEQVFDTGHAFSMTTAEGAELLVHIGFDTVELKGKHFTILSKSGKSVKRGEPVIRVDLEALRAEGYDTATPVVVLNGDAFAVRERKAGELAAGDTLFMLVPAGERD